ncbi:DUF1697 domain-containing protein [Hyphococcus luteus]|uniref:DUF1697 domain-containing protein n=1 Tax=Hyphococcus luteus TaxID=2058213 RepID=A0A2S7K3N6_9PROT|nr:DUF1697 domain-containing protein [Marinicaulis flavus]PQA87115.1 hypothetical protein CW354_13810 [Marinicaulis flavus]
MTQKVALLRGVNVGGKNRLPMKELAAMLSDMGCKNVRTYIQSGNVVYDGTATGADIASAINKNFGFKPQTFVMTAAALKKAVASAPFQKQAQADPKSVHLLFLEGEPQKGAEAELEEIKTAAEQFVLAKGVLYLHSPKGFAVSKIAEKADRILKTKTTARNWKTIEALIDLTGRKS